MTKRRKNSPRRKEDNDSYESRAQSSRKRRKMGDIASENSRGANCPHLPAVTAKVKTPVLRKEDNDSPSRKRRKWGDIASENSRDADCPHLPAVTAKVKTPVRRIEDTDNCSDIDDTPIEPCKKRRKRSHSGSERSSDTDCPPQLPALTETRKTPCCRTEESDSCNDSDESPIKPCRKSSRSNSGDSENESSDSDCPLIVYAEVQGIVAKNNKSYHDDEPVCDDEGEVTGHTSMRYSRTERNRNIVRVSCPETEGEGVSEEVRIFSRHSTAAPTTESGNIGAEPMPSTSSGAAAHTSQCRKDKESENCPACPICLQQFTTQEVGTPDTCDHIFCADCIKNWGKYASTCPVDRQPFSVINVRPHPGGEIITEIPSESTSQELLFCRVCGECDHEDRMLLCDRETNQEQTRATTNAQKDFPEADRLTPKK
ncbi:uncharacterized protein LOC111874572 [Cryptotermes secundus]|uniref:uncharacterized protein LOC111874572 n=1 Tax=Cryptotermes secundus TaxID=105785 RepID=UPI000CD7B5D0|nr:uncharacterized protein LOC111874572 [Cryptotermes secundus]